MGGFAGVSCTVHLSDGRRLTSSEGREQIEERMDRRLARSLAMLEIEQAGGLGPRHIGVAAIVEIEPHETP